MFRLAAIVFLSSTLSACLEPGSGRSFDNISSWDENGKFCGGSGTASDPYLICNAEQLLNIDGEVKLETGDYDNSMRGKVFRIVKDIDLSTIVPHRVSGVNTTAIKYFEGELDGGGHALYGYGSTDPAQGAFIGASAGTIRSLVFKDFHVELQVGGGAFLNLNYSDGSLIEIEFQNGEIRLAGANETGYTYLGVIHTNTSGILDVKAKNLTLEVDQSVPGRVYVGTLVGLNDGDGHLQNILVENSSISSIDWVPAISFELRYLGEIVGSNLVPSASRLGGFKQVDALNVSLFFSADVVSEGAIGYAGPVKVCVDESCGSKIYPSCGSDIVCRDSD